MTVSIGIIANPFSARDIRRVVADASGMQLAERANIILRVLAGLFVRGVGQAVMMPDKAGLFQYVLRGIARSQNQGSARYPELIPLDMCVRGTAEDSQSAAALLRDQGAAAIVVLGGDGTHRAVVSSCGSIPIAAISTGTNNAFAEIHEPTLTGIAVGLAATGCIPQQHAYRAHKRLDLSIDGKKPAIALVDIAFVTDFHVGARALWRTETFRELFVTFADPGVIGMSAIAGLLEPVARSDPFGLQLNLVPLEEAASGNARVILDAPIAPGLIAPIGIKDWARLQPGQAFSPRLKSGSIAFDGEREISFREDQHVSITLQTNAFFSINVPGCLHYAATHGLMRQDQAVCHKAASNTPPLAVAEFQ